MSDRFAGPTHMVFARHSNPWSAWTRWLSTPLVLVPLWTRRWSHAARYYSQHRSAVTV